MLVLSTVLETIHLLSCYKENIADLSEQFLQQNQIWHKSVTQQKDMQVSPLYIYINIWLI